jgi:molecular chaperone GrpE (heat shock protein)
MSRDDLMRRFEQWLDEALAAEEPPAGIDAEMLAALADTNPGTDDEIDRPMDAYTLLAAMTALTHEVKLQGRAFKELHTTIGAEAARVADEVRTVYREGERDRRRDAERRGHREILGALLDLRDGLWRGLESVRAVESAIPKGAGQSRLVRFFTKRLKNPDAEKLAALTTGYELGLQRLDQTLDELNAHEIRCQGQPFDPRRMNAIDKEESAGVPDGTVLEVYRTGYEWCGEVFRTAQVKVSRAPSPGQRHE